ncbi:Cohesin loading factor [Macrophomina phaseolina MS6]|uniref:Cohesin loading factor n=1 Tax=Macrophomina phaseolina (strain MS6) TaxID=1126212 RepID=K2RET2_MACPH|nr:Cohesin loading factor [Macrophomina phaseolina MS6]
MHYYHQPQQPQPGGYGPPRPPSHGYPPQQQPGGYPQMHSSSAPAPVAGSPGAYLAAQQQHQPYSLAAPAPPQAPHRPGHPVVMIPQRAPQQHMMHQQQQVQPYPPQPPQYPSQHSSPPFQPPRPQPPYHSRPASVAVPQSGSPPRQPTVQVQIPRPGPSSPAPIDKEQLLLSLADEYVAAAHAMGSSVALSRRQSDENKYYKLMSTALGCMEAALKNSRMHPRLEAALILRYASLLHEETENTVEEEEILSKGITLCERHRMLDLKYTMQHLLAQSLFKSSHAAALKSIDGVIHYAEMYQHIPWIYAFRFLRASLCMQSDSHSELTSAMHTLHEVSSLSERLGDSAIYVASTTIMAMVHLRLMNPDSVEQAQRAIASARSLQLQLTMDELGQIITLLDIIDLACNLQSYRPNQAVAKVRDLQVVMDSAVHGDDQTGDDGTFSILIHRNPNAQLTGMTGGIFQKNSDGRDRLSISWMRRRDLWMLGYYLSGVTALLKNSTEAKADSYLKEGLKLTRETLTVPDRNPSSISGASARMEWHRALDWHLRLYQCFMACNKAEWKAARAHLAALDQAAPMISEDRRPAMTRFAIYLNGVIEQGCGNTETALSHFRMLYVTAAVPNQRTVQSDLSVLAIMNTLLMIRSPTHPMHSEAEGLLQRIEQYCQSHPNQSMVSAFELLKATTRGKDSSIIKMKQCIQKALHAAKAVTNNQLLCICMNYMTAAFFTNIIGEQTEKSARAGKVLARRAGDKLWQCVADHMLADTYEKRGDAQQAASARAEAQAFMPYLPAPLREPR